MDSMESQVTGERSPDEQTTFEFEIATLATDGSGFSGEKVLLLLWPRLCHKEGLLHILFDDSTCSPSQVAS